MNQFLHTTRREIGSWNFKNKTWVKKQIRLVTG